MLNFTIVGQLRVIRCVKHVVAALDPLVIHHGSEFRSMNIVVTPISLRRSQRRIEETKEGEVAV